MVYGAVRCIGVPIAVKDLCCTEYAPTAAGCWIHKDFVPPLHFVPWSNVSNAPRAIVLGRAVDDGRRGCDPPSRNADTGQSMACGCMDRRVVGGSGAATAAGLSYGRSAPTPADRSASPSAACGLTGLQANLGSGQPLRRLPAVGNAGSHRADDAHRRPLRRDAGGDHRCQPAPMSTALLAPVPDYVAGLTGGIRGLRIGIAQAYAFDELDDDVLTALTGAKDALVALGARDRFPVDFPSLAERHNRLAYVCRSSEVAIAHEATYPQPCRRDLGRRWVRVPGGRRQGERPESLAGSYLFRARPVHGSGWQPLSRMSTSA